MSEHPVIDSLRASFDSYVQGHGTFPDALYLSKESIGQYWDEVLALNTKLHGYGWVYDRPMFHGVDIYEIGTNHPTKWVGVLCD